MMADASLLKHLDGALILLDVKDAEIKELREAQDRTADELGQAIGSGEQLLARAEAAEAKLLATERHAADYQAVAIKNAECAAKAEANLARAREIMKPFGLANNLDRRVTGTERLRLMRMMLAIEHFEAASRFLTEGG